MDIESRRAREATADACAQFSPRFDRARFLEACGMSGGGA